MLEILTGAGFLILCLCVLIDKLYRADKDLSINKEGLEVYSTKENFKPNVSGKE